MKIWKQKDKRDWKGYENKLIEKKRKFVEFFFKKPTKEELEEELNRMNNRKVGRKFEIPNSIMQFSELFKHSFSMDDRTEVIFVSKLMNSILCSSKEFDHSTIVKRRADMDLDIPFRISPEKLNGKRLYFDGMCLRVGRGGYYRSKEYKTPIKYLKIGVFTDDQGDTVDFTIGDEHDAEINMIREKIPVIKKSKAKSLTVDGAGSAKDVIIELTESKIEPVIRANVKVVESMKTKPPPYACIKKKKYEDLVWERYIREQEDYEKWRKKTKYSDRWVFSEGKFSSFKRRFGEETVSRTQKALHDEICIKFMLLDGHTPDLWK
jgi:hypothetical protein